MYNIFKNKIYSHFYSTFVKDSYLKVSEIPKEEVYYKKKKNLLVVLVKDEEIGSRIYDIIKTLKDRNDEINTGRMSFKVIDYIVDKQNTVQMFSLNFAYNYEISWNDLSKPEKLQEFVAFVDVMQIKGYILNETKFEDEKCSSISALLSFFDLTGTKSEKVKGCIIKHIHYALSGGSNFDEFYTEITNKNEFSHISDFPYELPIIKLCYNYFSTGNIPEYISGILEKENIAECSENEYMDYLVLTNNNLTDYMSMADTNNEFTIYTVNSDESIKIYNNISSEFSDFLEDRTNFLKYNMKYCLEQIDRLIIDCNGNVIGYKFTLKNPYDFSVSILDDSEFLTSQMSIFESIRLLEKQLKRLNSYRINFGEKENDFDIEKSQKIMHPGYQYKVEPLQNTIKDLFNLVTQNPCIIEKQIIDLLFKMLLNYLNNKYGEFNTEQEILEKEEIRYLTPGLVKEFVNYVLNNKSYDYYEAYKNLLDLSENHYTNLGIKIIYDKKFVYDPEKVSFLFDYEVKNQYGIKLKKGMEEILSDGSKLVVFDDKTSIKKLKDHEDDIIDQLDSIGCDEERRDGGKTLKVAKIIYSKKIDSNGMYKPIGYITQPLKGEPLTDDFILNLNNKELLKFIGYYLSIFSKVYNQYIPWNNNTIWVNKENDTFTFYLDILNSNFSIENTYTDSFSWIKDYLIDKGYNPNAFMGLESFKQTRNFVFGDYEYDSLLALSDSLDSYCEDHKIYYDSKKMACPVCLESKFFITPSTKNNLIKLFEDSVATHYRIDISDGFKQYNLKVYKKPCNINIKEIEKNIDEIVSRRIIHKELDLGQKCFVPYKKAFNSKSEFVGYIYEAVDFDNALNIDMDNITVDPSLCTNLNKLKNRPRLKCLIRLLSQVDELTENGFTFIDNPFSNVYLSKEHKKQVQILNIEFAKKRRNKRTNLKNTKNWAYQYVSHIISLDDTLELEEEYISGFDSLYKQLLELESNLTNYCSIHKLYYHKKYAFCPKCIDKKEFDEVKKEFVEVSKITSNKHIGDGGESTIYPYENNSVAKIFKTDEDSEVNLSLKIIILTKMWQKRDILERLNMQNCKIKYIYPKKVLFSKSNELVGYIMDNVENGLPLSTLRNKEKLEELGLTRKDVLEILITVGEGIKALHDEANIYIGDLNGDNILFDANKNVYFLDFDGMGIDDIAPRFFTDEYLDPLSEDNITMKDDWYSFAIQAFHYLTFVHPFNGIYSTVVDGRKVNLEIVDKMAQRISLLGNHGIKVPDVAESWDWMEDDLKNIFLNIFEGNVRESIVPQLQKQYAVLYGTNIIQSSDNKKSLSINSKYIAIPTERFLYEPVQVINDYSIIATDNEDSFVCILANGIQHTIKCSTSGIKNVLLSDNENFAFIIYIDEILVIDLKLNRQIYKEIGFPIENAVLNGNNLYYTDMKNGKNVIFKLEFICTPEVQVKKDTINFLTEQETRGFLAKFNSKFVIVKHSLDGSEDEIYCNEEKLCSITCNNSNPAYNIIYDDASNSWLVINNEGNGIIIKTLLGTYERINIRDIIGNCRFNINSIIFAKGYIYIPTQNCLHLINTIDQAKTKKMEVDKIITPDSKLYNISPKGFSVIEDNKFYDIRKK